MSVYIYIYIYIYIHRWPLSSPHKGPVNRLMTSSCSWTARMLLVSFSYKWVNTYCQFTLVCLQIKLNSHVDFVWENNKQVKYNSICYSIPTLCERCWYCQTRQQDGFLVLLSITKVIVNWVITFHANCLTLLLAILTIKLHVLFKISPAPSDSVTS